MQRIARRLLIVIWAVSVVTGLAVLVNHQVAPGKATVAGANWPPGTAFELDSQQPTLVMFVHPNCPCSRASLGELAKLATDCPGATALRLVFVQPAEFKQGWERTDLWHKAKRIPQASLSEDHEGGEARRFGARTSGEAFVYGPGGDLLFHGGITGSRGHEGSSIWRDEIEAVLRGQKPKHRQGPVYGCSLFLENEP